jgi:hypothetical protein
MTDYPARDAAVRAFQRRRKAQRIAERGRTRGVTVALNPPIDKSGRDPIFDELDKRIAEEAEQDRRRVSRAENGTG